MAGRREGERGDGAVEHVSERERPEGASAGEQPAGALGGLRDGAGKDALDAAALGLKPQTDIGLDPRTGEPRIFYHGTKDDVGGFDLNHPNRKDRGWLGRGVYATASREVAEAYADAKRGDGAANVIPLFIRARSTLMVDMQDANERVMFMSQARIDAMTDRQKVAGRDSVAATLQGADPDELEVVVFDPAGVKSAVGNSGAFDAGDTRINYSRGTDDAGAPLLTTQTNADILAREKAAKDSAAAKAKADAEAEAKAKADAQRDDFALTGSNRAADQAGQGSLFSRSAGEAGAYRRTAQQASPLETSVRLVVCTDGSI